MPAARRGHLPVFPTSAGPTRAPEELAGHKLLALFDRAAARDFADIYVLAGRFGKNVPLARAKQIDAGFDTAVLVDMIATSTGLPTARYPYPRLVRGRTASVLHGLAIGAHSISRVRPEPG